MKETKPTFTLHKEDYSELVRARLQAKRMSGWRTTAEQRLLLEEWGTWLATRG